MVGTGVVICLEQGAHLHMPHLMPLPLTVSCFSKIQIGFTFLVPAHPGSPGQRVVKRVCVCVCVCVCELLLRCDSQSFIMEITTCSLQGCAGKEATKLVLCCCGTVKVVIVWLAVCRSDATSPRCEVEPH